mmetsp:Transcript_17171/g.34814  ORF Transcript_17171/g.34814 Transcript_17171/m.34814 type:complete len:232 (+) Transcript_17171:1015-1710(+)
MGNHRVHPFPRDCKIQRRQPGVLDESPRQFILQGEFWQVDVVRETQLGRSQCTPDALSQEVVWFFELHGEGDAPVHGLVKVVGPVGCKNRESVVSLQLGEDCVDCHWEPLSGHEDGLALVKEHNGVVDLRLSEHHFHDGPSRVVPQVREVDQQNLFPQTTRKGICQHRLASPRRAPEQKCHARAVAHFLLQLQVFLCKFEVIERRHCFYDKILLVFRKHHVCYGGCGCVQV